MRSLITFLALVLMLGSQLSYARNALSFKLKASVVKVHVATKSGGHGVGTGVAVGKDLIVTNCHVLANRRGAKITKFGKGFVPVALKADWKHDLCILRFEYLDMTPVELGDSDSLQYEQEIFSIGFPGGPPRPQYSEGKIKALYTLGDSAIVRTDASFVMGASGSPIFDSKGRLIAISTFKSPGRKAYYFSMPVKWVKALIDAPETTSMATNESPFWDAPEEKRPFFMRVTLPFKNKKWNELQEIAQQWIKAEPTSAEAFYYAGIAEEQVGSLDKAKQHFEQALTLHPNHPATLIALGLIANRAGNVAEVENTHTALKAIDKYLDIEFTEALKPKAE
jgi:hypothetical protein